MKRLKKTLRRKRMQEAVDSTVEHGLSNPLQPGDGGRPVAFRGSIILRLARSLSLGPLPKFTRTFRSAGSFRLQE